MPTTKPRPPMTQKQKDALGRGMAIRQVRGARWMLHSTLYLRHGHVCPKLTSHERRIISEAIEKLDTLSIVKPSLPEEF